MFANIHDSDCRCICVVCFALESCFLPPVDERCPECLALCSVGLFRCLTFFERGVFACFRRSVHRRITGIVVVFKVPHHTLCHKLLDQAHA